MATQEKNYFILAVDKNRLVFAISARDTSEQMPIILYDGGKHALFYRNREETVVLDYLDDRARPLLSDGQHVAFVEINPETEKMTRQYMALVKMVDKLPYLKLEEKA